MWYVITMIEEWKTCPSLPEYEASSLGRIRRKVYSKSMPYGGTRTYGGKAHYGVAVNKPKRMLFFFRGKNYKVHRIVCEAFHGPAPFKGAVVLHINEDGHDNRPENLKWGTQKENLNAPGFIEYCKSRVGENSPYLKGKSKRKKVTTKADPTGAFDESQRQQAPHVGPDAGLSDMPAVGAGASPDVCRALCDGEEERR